METLTPSLEDYLEAIWTIILREKVARVKDIAKSLGVTTPSVVNALNSLSEKNLVKHDKYGYVELTDQGAATAQEVDRKHKTLFYVLSEIFGVDPETAYKDACKIEHHLSDNTIQKIDQFVQFFQEQSEGKASLISKYQVILKKRERDMGEGKGRGINLTLDGLKPGEKGRVIKIKGKGNLKKRLLDMGVVSGTEIELKKVAPLGDPIDILVKGYHLSLRKEEAKEILLAKV